MATKSDARALPIAATKINIGEWLFGLSDEEYRATARAHLGAGTFRVGARRGFFDAEQFPGVVIVNHHVEEEARPDYVRVHSPDSRAWLFGLVPVRLDVCWEMIVRPLGPDRCQLECRLRLDPRRRPLRLLAAALGAPIVHRRHLREQMTGFVESVLETHRSRDCEQSHSMRPQRHG